MSTSALPMAPWAWPWPECSPPVSTCCPRGAWETVFVALALWFSGRAGRGLLKGAGGHTPSHYGVHLVMTLAMTYMYVAALPTRAGSGVASMSAPTAAGADFVAVPLVFVVVLLVSAVWQLDALSRYAPSSRVLVAAGSDGAAGSVGTGSSSPWLAPRLEMGCHIATCVVMAYVLVLMF